MSRVVAIVEGHGEVAALPVLLRRMGPWLTPDCYTEIFPPIRVAKDRFLNRPDEFSRHLQLAASKCGDAGWVLLLLDADDDCPSMKGADILARAKAVVPYCPIAVVLANREYESWFIASAISLNGRRGFSCGPEDASIEAELPRNAKGWLAQRMDTGVYRETSDQAAFSELFDMALAHERSRSFRKLCSEWTKNVTA